MFTILLGMFLCSNSIQPRAGRKGEEEEERQEENGDEEGIQLSL